MHHSISEMEGHRKGKVGQGLEDEFQNLAGPKHYLSNLDYAEYMVMLGARNLVSCFRQTASHRPRRLQ